MSTRPARQAAENRVFAGAHTYGTFSPVSFSTVDKPIIRYYLHAVSTSSRRGQHTFTPDEVPSNLPRAIFSLAIQRIFIVAGKNVRVALEIKAEDFSHDDEEAAAFVVDPDFAIQAGASSRDIRLKGIVRLR